MGGRRRQAFHSAIHGGGDWRTGRALSKAKGGGKELTPEMQAELDAWVGEWNTTVMAELRETETLAGEPLPRDEVVEIVESEMRRFGIPIEYVPYRGGQ